MWFCPLLDFPVCLEQEQLIQWLHDSFPINYTEKVWHSSERELEIKVEEANGTSAVSLDEIIPVPKTY